MGEIAKSLVFRAGDRAVVAVMSGDNRLDPARIAAVVGEDVGRADADFVRATTGFAIGGVPPLGHATPVDVFMDEDLFPLRRDLGGGGQSVQRVRGRAGAAARSERGDGDGAESGLTDHPDGEPRGGLTFDR